MTKHLGGALRDLPVPEPAPDLRARILTSRAAGVRVVLPAGDARHAARRVVRAVVGIAAAVVVAIGLLPRGGAEEDAVPSATNGFWWPPDVLAQEPGGKRYIASYPVAQLDQARFVTGRWVFQTRMIIDGFTTDTVTADTLAISTAEHGGTTAWQIANRWGNRYFAARDTLFVARDGLRPLRRAGAEGRTRRANERPRAFDFPKSGRFGPLLLAPVPTGYAGSQLHPFMRPALGLLNYLYLKPVLQTLPIGDRWRGSVYVTWSWRGPTVSDPIPLDARVVGRETIDVPAGRFECWKVELQVPSNKAKTLAWISTREHWVVRLREPLRDGALEEVLVSATPPPP